MRPTCEILIGDCREVLKSLPNESVNCCVTSPPYFGLRDYGVVGQLGLEQTPDAYVAELVMVFREVRRVLRSDGTVWLNLGDSYAQMEQRHRNKQASSTLLETGNGSTEAWAKNTAQVGRKLKHGLKHKDLIGIPWRVAFALQADGWYLRQDIIWSKPNPMPESVTDRCTKAHEYVFLLSKSKKYYFDSNAIRNPPSEALLEQVLQGYNGTATKEFGVNGAQDASATKRRIISGARKRVEKVRGHERTHEGFRGKWDAMTKQEQMALGSNKRSVWTIGTKPFRGAHFATFPPELIKPCILAGCPVGGKTLDPFGGSGTTGRVAMDLGRSAVLIELNPEYAKLCWKRVDPMSDPMF